MEIKIFPKKSGCLSCLGEALATPEAVRLITFTLMGCSKAIKITFMQLNGFDEGQLSALQRLNALCLGDLANIFHVHAVFLVRALINTPPLLPEPYGESAN